MSVNKFNGCGEAITKETDNCATRLFNLLIPIVSVLVVSMPAFKASAESVQELRTMQLIRATYLDMKACEGIEALSGYPGDCSADLSHDFEALNSQLQNKLSPSEWKHVTHTSDWNNTQNIYHRLKGIADDTASERAARAKAYQTQKAAEKAAREADKAADMQAREDASNERVRAYNAKITNLVSLYENCAQNYETSAEYPAKIEECNDLMYFYVWKEQVYAGYKNLPESERSKIDIGPLNVAYQHSEKARSECFIRRNEAKKAELCKGTKSFLGKLTMNDYQRSQCR